MVIPKGNWYIHDEHDDDNDAIHTKWYEYFRFSIPLLSHVYNSLFLRVWSYLMHMCGYKKKGKQIDTNNDGVLICVIVIEICFLWMGLWWVDHVQWNWNGNLLKYFKKDICYSTKNVCVHGIRLFPVLFSLIHMNSDK